jgi:Fur family ferric uptake transcriptional regulator
MARPAQPAPAIDPALVLERLVAQGHRVTRPRREILNQLTEQGGTTAQALFETLRATGSGIGRATVFRTLDLLSAMGVVERIHRPDGCHTYVLAQPGHRHHLVCSDCGTVVEFSECALEESLATLARRTAFRISGHWLEVVGLCGTCQSQQEAASPSPHRPA